MASLSADKAALLHQYFDAFNRRDVEAWLDLTHPDITLVPTPYWAPQGTIYYGREGLRTYAHEMFERLPYLHSEPTELRDLGERVLGRGQVVSGSDKASASARTIACLFELKDGRIYRIDAFRTWTEGLEAARRRSQDPFGRLVQHASDPRVLADERSVEPRLTPREREVFRCLALGLNTAEVAEQLALSPHTVRTHVEKGIARLEAKNRVHAIAIALMDGEIEL